MKTRYAAVHWQFLDTWLAFLGSIRLLDTFQGRIFKACVCLSLESLFDPQYLR